MADNQQSQPSSSPVRMGTASTQLKMKFGTMSGEKTWSFNHADDNVDESYVRALGEAMITNGEIFNYPPLVLNEAWIESKTITPYVTRS